MESNTNVTFGQIQMSRSSPNDVCESDDLKNCTDLIDRMKPGAMVGPITVRIPLDDGEENMVYAVEQNTVCIVLERKLLENVPYSRVRLLTSDGIVGWTFSDYLRMI